MDNLISLCRQQYDPETWAERSKKALESLFGSNGGRYNAQVRSRIQFRTPEYKDGKGVPFSSIIHESNPTSGGYGGMSFVIFPVVGAPPMIAMVVGTQGLSPDEAILGKPGHSRKMNAITQWLNSQSSENEPIAWAKRDAVRIDLEVPDNVRKAYPEYEAVFNKYGREIYGFCIAKEEILETVLKTFLDFNFEERSVEPLSKFQKEYKQIKQDYLTQILPTEGHASVTSLLNHRKYVVLQGPPGTGKTRLANELLQNEYQGRGMSIQFHPNTTYESFIGGMFPQSTSSELGLNFEVTQGSLLKAVELAKATDEKVLLIIDEINRADLAKVLGEAIYSLEPHEDRVIDLPYDFGGSIGDKLQIPDNLHILGTMNTADRSIAILDVAIRRRFAFLNMWPQIEVVREHGNETTLDYYEKLLSIFIEYASNDAFVLMPGHSYFITQNSADPGAMLGTDLVPLLKEYLAQGYVANFADAIHAYIQEVEQL